VRKFTKEWWASLRPEVAGKETETLVQDVLKAANNHANFAWHRLPDAKAARGAMAAQPADYMFRFGKVAGFLEVKALKHDYRLPASRLTQLPVLNKWALAGNHNYVLINHYMIGQWRIINTAELEFGVPSWDLRDYEVYSTPVEALKVKGIIP
jgi:hypothetical protein